MGALGVILIAAGILVVYEALKGGISTAAASSGSSPSSPLSSAGIANPAMWEQLLASNGITGAPAQKFLGIINRESGGQPNAICYAPGSDASQCTPTPKIGDTQGAFGPFQFLNSTWNAYGCTPSAPRSPLGMNYAALDPVAAARCAAQAYRANGFKDWGG